MAGVGRWTAGELAPSVANVAGARNVVTGIFKTFDNRGDGMFSCAALANVLRALDTGSAMTDKEIERLLRAIDTKKTGWIHYEAFCECIFGSMGVASPSSRSMSPAAPGGGCKAKARGGAGLGAEPLEAEPPAAELLAAEPLAVACKQEAISPVTSTTVPTDGEASSRSISEEEEETADLPLPSSGSGTRQGSFHGLNPILALELAAINGDLETPPVTTERIPRTPSTARSAQQGEAQQAPHPAATPASRQPSRQGSRGSVGKGSGLHSARRPSGPQDWPGLDGGPPEPPAGCPSLAASMSSVSLTYPATSSSARPPWGCVQGEATVAFVSCAQDANEQFRSYMEDGQKVIDPFLSPEDNQEGRWGFFAVYDGHGGRQAVDYCEERLHEVVLQELQNLSPEKDVSAALRGAFEKIDGELAMLGAWRTGCTATVALVHRTPSAATLYVANVGDSRAVLFGSVGTRRISNDHRASDPAEAARIAEEGGLVRHGRVGGQLIVSRSLGDHHLKGCGVSCVPEVHESDVGGDRALVIASDGLWDGLQDAEAGEVVDRCVERAVAQGGGEKAIAQCLRETTARDLVESAKERGSRDNILALVVFF
uniref:Protein-serine/threonine phosphatase n=1 Tax=Pyrodinium bahamense TaxID=73915 RepID=A0A7S0FXG6_9DINO